MVLGNLKIGDIVLDGNVTLAPMAGFGDVAFRDICLSYGASLTTTEMVSVKGLYYGNENTADLLKTADNEKIKCVQLFGSDGEIFRKEISENELLQKFDIIDINMGCPVRKITRNGEGSALMADTVTAEKVIKACVESTKKPITVKIRLGVDGEHINAVDFAKMLADNGAKMIAVHGRTTEQLYSGEANWEVIEKVASSVSVPVVGNGDIDSYGVFERRTRSSDCSGFMIGRASLGYPQIFADIKGITSTESRLEVAIRHIMTMKKYFVESYVVTNMRKHLAHYLKGAVGNKEAKREINSAESISQIIDVITLLTHKST